MMSTETAIRATLRQACHTLNVRPHTLCVVARPSAVRELRKVGVVAHAVAGIPEHAMGGGRFSSDAYIILRRDLWVWRGRGMRAKVLRSVDSEV